MTKIKKNWVYALVIAFAASMFGFLGAGLGTSSRAATDDNAAKMTVTQVKWLNATDTVNFTFSAGQSKTAKSNFESNIGTAGYEAFTDNLLVNGKTIPQLRAEGKVGRVDCHINWDPRATAYTVYLGLFKSNVEPWMPFEFEKGTSISFLPGFRRPMVTNDTFGMESTFEIKARQDFYNPADTIKEGSAWKQIKDADLVLDSTFEELDLTTNRTAQIGVSLPAGLDCAYVSGDTAVATVSDSGLITAVALGKTKITVTSGARSAVVTVEVVAVPYTGQSFGISVVNWLGDENFAFVGTGYNSQTPTDNDHVQVDAHYTDAKYADFYSHILVNGMTYADFAAYNQNPVGIRLCPGEAGMRIGAPGITSKTGDYVITFTRGMKLLKYDSASKSWVIDQNMRLSKTYSFLSLPKAGEWPVLGNNPSKVIFTNKAPANLKVGDTASFKAYAAKNYEEAAPAGYISYSVSDTSIATIDETTGALTVKKGGTFDVVAKTPDNVSAKKTYTVASTASLDKTEVSISKDATQQLTASVASDYDFTVSKWESSDPAVATVSNTGLVTGIADGTAVITVTLSNGDVAKCTVTVSTNITVKLSADKTTVKMGETVTLNALTNGTGKLLWSVSGTDASLQSEETEGTHTNVLVPVRNGVVTVTVKLAADETVTMTLEITINAVVTLDKTTAKGKPDATVQLSAEANPGDLTVTWSSANEAIATVSENGLVTFKAKGTVKITATAGGASAVCTVTVVVDTMTTAEFFRVADGHSMQLMWTKSPSFAAKTFINTIATQEDMPAALRSFFEKISVNGKNFIEYCNNFDRPIEIGMHLNQIPGLVNLVASERGKDDGQGTFPAGMTIVFESGLVLPEWTGSEWIASEYYITSNVMIEADGTGGAKLPQITGVSFANAAESLEAGKTLTLTPTVAGNKYLIKYEPAATWTSSDETVATVKDGVVTPVKAGKTTVTYTLGAHVASVEVTVTEKAAPPKDDGGKTGCGAVSGGSSGLGLGLLALALAGVLVILRKNRKADQ